jgi:acyl-CoA reductase-like NAD-dependent aldehyde dehydrogenase
VAAVQWHPEFHKPEQGVIDDAPILNDFLAARAGHTIMNTLAIHNPANGQLITTLPADDATSVATKTTAARVAQPAWAATPMAERKACIERFRSGVVRDLESLAVTMTRETGKPVKMSRNELNGLLGRIDFFLKELELSVATETVLRMVA